VKLHYVAGAAGNAHPPTRAVELDFDGQILTLKTWQGEVKA
jgi:hypothetical protein